MLYVDDGVEGLHREGCFHPVSTLLVGIIRLIKSDIDKPLNLGSDEMVSMNEMMAICQVLQTVRVTVRVTVRWCG